MIEGGWVVTNQVCNQPRHLVRGFLHLEYDCVKNVETTLTSTQFTYRYSTL